MLQFNQVSKRFSKKIIVQQFSYHFDQAHYCIAGENGIGKTTLLLMAAGLEAIDSGKVLFEQNIITSITAKQNIGISSDKILLPQFLNAQQLINFHCQQHHIEFPNILVTALNFNEQLNKKVQELSLGNSKKLSLILALAHQPKCLLLDEPSTGLDHHSRTWLLNYLRNYPHHTQRQIIVTSHEDDFIHDQQYTQLNFKDFTQLNSGLTNEQVR